MRLCRARRHRFITLPMALSAQPGAPQLYKLRNPIIYNTLSSSPNWRRSLCWLNAFSLGSRGLGVRPRNILTDLPDFSLSHLT